MFDFTQAIKHAVKMSTSALPYIDIDISMYMYTDL